MLFSKKQEGDLWLFDVDRCQICAAVTRTEMWAWSSTSFSICSIHLSTKFSFSSTEVKEFGWGRGRVLYSLSWQNVRYKLYRKVFEFCLSSEMTIADKRSFCLANNNSDGKSIWVFLLWSVSPEYFLTKDNLEQTNNDLCF